MAHGGLVGVLRARRQALRWRSKSPDLFKSTLLSLVYWNTLYIEKTIRSIDFNGKQSVISERLHNYYMTFNVLLLRLTLSLPVKTNINRFELFFDFVQFW